jgi:methenyltetrahydromethanopterin cyclohydrolase
VSKLNRLAWRRCDELVAVASRMNVGVMASPDGTRIIDCGVKSTGGLEAGRQLAKICLSALGRVELIHTRIGDWSGPAITVNSDQPVLACLASQYAGWQISCDKFFAMGSGPMRAVARKEPLFERINYQEVSERVVGVLETAKLPTDQAIEQIATACGVTPENVTLLVARTSSLAGTVQVVARSVETALHKLHELAYDLKNVASGFGVAPLPPVAADDMAAIGRTNDAILYGGEVTLWVWDDDDHLADIGARIPSNASRDFGEPFSAIFERAGRDFYKIDPMLFSPAVVTLMNLSTGRSFRFGELRPDVLARSFSS